MKPNTYFSLLACCALALGLTACTAPRLGVYTLRMDRVEHAPETAQEDVISTKTLADGSHEYHYEDELINIKWVVKNVGWQMELTNKGERSIKIPWDEAAYVNAQGLSMRVIHASVRFEDKEKVQAPSVVARNAKIIDFLTPADNIIPENRNYNTWKTYHLFYNKQRNVGDHVALLLPILMGDERIEYVFHFDITQWHDPTPPRQGFFYKLFK